MKLLFVEDDENFARVLISYLEDKGHEVMYTDNGMTGLELFKANLFDICILDVMLPLKDGYQLAREFREIHRHIPIVFLTAKNMKADIVRGFLSGADDYLVKPFDAEILHLKLKALHTRMNKGEDLPLNVFAVGKFRFYLMSRELVWDNQKILLSPRESQLLELFCMAPDGVVDKKGALTSLWNSDNYFNSRSMDVHIVRLKKKLAADPNVQIVNMFDKGLKLFVKSSILE